MWSEGYHQRMLDEILTAFRVCAHMWAQLLNRLRSSPISPWDIDFRRIWAVILKALLKVYKIGISVRQASQLLVGCAPRRVTATVSVCWKIPIFPDLCHKQ